MSNVAVIDYGMGNLHSVAKALEHANPNAKVVVTADHDAIRQAERVVLPGVGAIRDCVGEIKRLGLDQVVQQLVDSGTPLLGVCVGMQVLMTFSEENDGTDCLGVFAGKVKYFGDDLIEPDTGERLKIPHMGWNQVNQRQAHPLWEGIAQDARFYFVHSYYVKPEETSLSAATSYYGFNFTTAICRDNVFAVQFHPEKSQHDGLRLYKNFLNWNGQV